MIDAATVIDAQINYRIPKLKSTLKVGATNIGGKEYRQVLGAGANWSTIFCFLDNQPVIKTFNNLKKYTIMIKNFKWLLLVSLTFVACNNDDENSSNLLKVPLTAGTADFY